MDQVNASIPLSGIAAPIMGPREQMSLMELGRQMKLRNDVQNLMRTPGALDEQGLPTTQTLISLRKIDQGMGDAATMRRAQVLSDQDLARKRAEDAQKEMENQRTEDITDNIMAPALSRNYAAGGGEAGAKAMSDYITAQYTEWGKSGKLKRYQMDKPEFLQAMLSHSPDDVASTLVARKKGDVVERAVTMADARQQGGITMPAAKGKIVQGGEPLAEPITMAGEGPDETVDTKSGAVVRPETRDQLPEGEPLAENEPAGSPVVGNVAQLPETPVTAEKTPETPDALHDKAKAEEARAARLRANGATKAAKDADAKAKDYRTAAKELEGVIQKETGLEQKDRALDQADKRLQLSADRLKLQKDAEIPDDVASFVARQYVNGNSQAIVGWARNLQAKAAIGRAITVEARKAGLTAEGVNAKLAEFQGVMAGERTLGQREANLGTAVEELANFIPLAKTASDAVARTNFVPLNKLYRIGRNQWSPEQAKFEAANRSIINAFAQVASRSGGTTVHNTEEAEYMINTAQTQAQYNAVLDQLMREAEGARKAPGQVRKQMNRAITTGEDEETPDRPASKGTIHWNDLK